MKRHSLRPVVEQLECRLNPASFAFAWPDAQHLTLSLVPDGTLVGGQTVGIANTGQPLTTPTVAGATGSSLFGTLGPSTNAWELALLRAFQTWAAAANINFSLVADNGQPLGSVGPLQGASGFGDIRIAAVPNGPGGSYLSTGIPFDPLAGTWSGDVILNSAASLGVGGQETYDLFTVALHEAGHALGLQENLDPASAMFSYYNGPRTGLAPEDVAAIQALYGARSADSLEGFFSNDIPLLATDFGVASLLQYTSRLLNTGKPMGAPLPPLTVEADVSTQRDVDWYVYNSVPSNPGFTLQLQTSGVSLLDAKVSVYDWKGRLLQSVSASDALHGDLSIRIDGINGREQYFIKVESGSPDAFGVGAYRLRIVPDSSRALAPFNVVNLLSQLLPPPNNHSQASATTLQSGIATTNERFDFRTMGQLSSAGQTDFYRFQAPQSPGGVPQTLAVMVWGQSGGLDPTVTVYDAQGNVQPVTVIGGGNGVYIVELPNAVSGATYYASVQAAQAAGPNNTGSYFLGADFTTNTKLADQLFVSGSLGGTVGAAPAARFASFAAVIINPPPPPPPPPPASPVLQDFRSLVLTENLLFHLNFAVQTPGAALPMAVEFTLLDANNQVVYDRVLHPGESASVDLYLLAGTYTLRVVAAPQDLSATLPVTNYQISGTALNGPIGPPLVDPTKPPTPLPTPFTWLDSALFRFLALFDPYGRPIQ